jgi:Rod binding domain-containing protein
MTSLSPVDFSASLNAIAKASSSNAQSQLQAGSTSAQSQLQATDTSGISVQSLPQIKALDGDGPFGGKGSLKIWRSFMTDQIAKSFAKTGGIGLAPHVYEALLRHQGISA